MNSRRAGEAGFTLVELTVTVVIIGIVVISFFGLFVSLVHSTIVAKRRAVALTLATNQMETLKALPYDSLAVQSPTTATKKINGVTYTVTSNVRYIDDAYDGCGAGYNAQTPASVYCRNYPPPSGAPNPDLNPDDYKIARVVVSDSTGAQLASVDTEIAARVSETASTTGALFVHVVDGSGAAVSGATVTVANSTLVPAINRSDSTDENGTVIFYGLPPDSGNDYIISASKSGNSSLSTIGVSGTLQPTYASQKVLTQQSSTVTLPIYPIGTNSLIIETTDTSGSPLGGVKVYAKGGYKMYTSTSDYSYYFDNYYANYNTGALQSTDNRLATDSTTGLGVLNNLVPANGYIFCNSDNAGAATNCKAGSTTYYLAAAIPYGGQNALQPITVPTYDPANPPAVTYDYGGTAYLQKVRLMLTSSSTFPRVYTMNPYQLSLGSASNLSNFLVTVTGANLSSATMKFIQGSNTYNGTSCSNSATQVKCSFDFSSVTTGNLQLAITNSAGTLTLPITPLGGFSVNP